MGFEDFDTELYECLTEGVSKDNKQEIPDFNRTRPDPNFPETISDLTILDDVWENWVEYFKYWDKKDKERIRILNGVEKEIKILRRMGIVISQEEMDQRRLKEIAAERAYRMEGDTGQFEIGDFLRENPELLERDPDFHSEYIKPESNQE